MTAILLDQGLAPGTAALLREHAFDAVHVVEIGLDRAEDLEILAVAAAQNRICVTLDHDFHTHLALAGQGRPSVILLRIEGIGAAAQAELIAALRPVRGEFIKSRCNRCLILPDSASASDSRQNSLATRTDRIWQAAKEHTEDNHLNTMCQRR